MEKERGLSLVSEKPIGEERRLGQLTQMVNWYKIAGIVLTILGIFILLGGMLVVVAREAIHYITPLWVPALAIVMIAVGVYLYYLGIKRQKKGV